MKLQDSQHFTSLCFADDDSMTTTKADKRSVTTMSDAKVKYADASNLRLGKYVLIHGFPSRVKEIQKSAPGKHGHTKLRVVAVGLFDKKKREIIFGGHEKILVPEVETRSNILGSCHAADDEQDGGYEIVAGPSSEIDDLPSILSWSAGEIETDDAKTTPQHGTLTVTVSCGYYKVTQVRPINKEEANELKKKFEKETKAAVAAEEEVPSVLSKKEQRKVKKLKKRSLKRVAATEESHPATDSLSVDAEQH